MDIFPIDISYYSQEWFPWLSSLSLSYVTGVDNVKNSVCSTISDNSSENVKSIVTFVKYKLLSKFHRMLPAILRFIDWHALEF